MPIAPNPSNQNECKPKPKCAWGEYEGQSLPSNPADYCPAGYAFRPDYCDCDIVYYSTAVVFQYQLSCAVQCCGLPCEIFPIRDVYSVAYIWNGIVNGINDAGLGYSVVQGGTAGPWAFCNIARFCIPALGCFESGFIYESLIRSDGTVPPRGGGRFPFSGIYTYKNNTSPNVCTYKGGGLIQIVGYGPTLREAGISRRAQVDQLVGS